jgi:hypothetical protein
MTTDTAALRGAERITSPPAARPPLHTRHRTTLLLLAAALGLGVLGPLLLSWWTGSLHIPHNDTWAFSRSAEIFSRTGHIRLFNWNAMALIGAFVPLGPFGRSITAQQCAIAMLAVVSLAAAFDVLRRAVGPRRGALGVLMLVCWPGFGLLSTSLMTDIPAFAAMVLTLAVGWRAIERESVPLFTLCGLIGLWGFTVREQTVAATIAVLGAALLRPGLRTRAMLLRFGVLAVVLGAAAGAFELWRRALPNGSSPTFNRIVFPGTTAVIEISLGGLLMLGLMISPLVFLAARPSTWSRAARCSSLAAFVIGVGGVRWYHVQFPQNYFDIQGSYLSASLGVRPDVVPQTVWNLMVPLACLSTALLVGITVDRFRRIRPELAFFLVLTLLGTLLEVVEGEILFDRYIFPAAVPAIAIVLHEPLRGLGRFRKAFTGAVGVVLVTVITLLTMNALSFDAATWRTAQGLVTSGAASADYVDAGLDWTGFHSPDGAQNLPDPNSMFGIYGKSSELGNDHPCYVVAASPQVQDYFFFTLFATTTYDKYGIFGSQNTLYVYRTYMMKCH